MAAYHILLVHFPIALWTTATLAMVLRALSDGSFARTVDRALVPLLALGVLSGAGAYAVGLTVWPFEGLSSTPLGRNHMLAATWTLAFWTVLLATRWIQGERVWEGVNRWIMLLLALVGVAFVTVTGTLGGHLTGTATAVSKVLRGLGWEVYTTYYVPTTALALVAAAAVGLVVIGWIGRGRTPASG